MSSKPHLSIPFSSTGQIPIPTPPSSSGSNQAFSHLSPSGKFVHPARRRGSADSYLSEDDHHYHNYNQHSVGRSPSYSYSLTSNNRRSHSQQLGSSPGACLIIRSSSGSHSPRSNSPQIPSPRRASGGSNVVPTRSDSLRSISSPPSGELEFDVEPLSPFSYAPRLPSLPPSRKNSRDAYSHVNPPVSALTQKLEKHQQQQALLQQQQQQQQVAQLHSPKQQYQQQKYQQQAQASQQQLEEDEETTIQLHMMPKNMLLPLPDRNAEMKHLLEHNSLLAAQIKRRLGEERYSAAFDLWTRTRRSELSDHEWLRRSRYFLRVDEKLWNEWAMMVGWDFSRDLTKDEKGEVRGVEEYAGKMGHMACLEEEEE